MVSLCIPRNGVISESEQSSPFRFRQGTEVDPSLDYWMGSIAMDEAGNIALGFSVSSDPVVPSAAVVGLTRNDRLGTMEAPLFLVNGTGAGKQLQTLGRLQQVGGSPRGLHILALAQEYYKTIWSTRIASSTHASES